MTSILADSLGLSCYNCGQDGNGIILNYGRLRMIAPRHTPRLVLYDIQPTFDLQAGDDNAKYLKWLRPYYDREGIGEIFRSVDRAEPIKMRSALYRYNSSFLQIMSDCISPQQSKGLDGYRPLLGEMDTMKVTRRDEDETPPVVFDSLKLHYWQRFFELTAETRLVLVLSPTWSGLSPDAYQPLEAAARQRGLLLVNFANDAKYLHNAAYFKDGGHLNARGAEEFTRDLAARLRAEGLAQP